MTRNTSIRRGFTLVELLVVIAVLAVLLSILLPSIRKLKEAAWSVQCMSNLRQIGVGLTMYSTESGQNIPQDISYDNTGHRGIIWSSFLTGEDTRYPGINKVYITTIAGTSGPTVFRCPKMDLPNVWNTRSEYGMYHSKSGSEAFTYRCPDLTFPCLRGIHLSMIRDRARYPLIFDTSAFNDYKYASGSATWMSEGLYPTGNPTDGLEGVWMAHGNTANALFADFHAEGCDATTLRSLTVPNRYTSTKRGVSAWKTQNGTAVSYNGIW